MKWRFLNVLTFTVCTIVLLYQSSEFLNRFCEYPTNIKIEKTSFSTRDSFPLPAFTICYENTSRNKFCDQYPSLCQNVPLSFRFCLDYIHFCDGTEFTRLPMLGFHTAYNGHEIYSKAIELLTNDNYTVPFLIKPRPRTLKTTFVKIEGSRFARCYTDNLHLNDNERERIFEKRGLKADSAEVLFDIQLNIISTEVLFDPWIFPHAYFAIHSPFEPINPVHSGERLRLGKDYFVTITRLEEDHLLPHPYQTDCMDYEALNKENNMTGPRSQEICLDLCRAEYFKKCNDCNGGLRMYETLHNFCGEYNECLYDTFRDMPKITEKCHSICKPDCRKLKYHYKFAKFTINEKTNRSTKVQELLAKGHPMKIRVSIRNPDIFVLSHVPMFNSEELFSYIGGLMGCWLGVSVWSFTDTIEKNFRRIRNLKNSMKRRGRPSTKRSYVINI